MASVSQFLINRVGSVLKGFRIAGKPFRLLAFSASQLRSNSAWMMSPSKDFTPETLRDWLGDFTQIDNPGKFASRVGQAFSSGLKILGLQEDQIKEIPDIQRNGHTFTDGIGTISQELLTEINCKINRNCSALQFRMGGVKGVVSLDDSLRGKVLCVRKSMIKFGSEHREFELVNPAVSRKGFLNRQLIMLLSTLGVADNTFMSFQDRMLEDLEDFLSHGVLEYLYVQSPANLCLQTFSNFRHFSDEPMYKKLKNVVKGKLLDDLLQKSRILVNDSALLMGVVDEKGVLNYGEVYISIDNRPIQAYAVVVAKNPCLHPGDVRKLRIVNNPLLRHHNNVIVFPSQGEIPHPKECSGSDLDGDLYFVSWNNYLFPKYTVDAMAYDIAPPVKKPPPFGRKEMIEVFQTFILNENLGRIDNAHLVIADRSAQYALDPDCIELCKLHSTAVDFPKNGVFVELPAELAPKEYPDFMMKAPSYESQKVLGKLFRSMTEFLQRQHGEENEYSTNESFHVPGNEQYLTQASDMVLRYYSELKSYLTQYGIPEEVQFLTGQVGKTTGIFTNIQREHEIQAILTCLSNQLILKYRDEFAQRQSRELASALYITAYAHDPPLFVFPWAVAGDKLTLNDNNEK